MQKIISWNVASVRARLPTLVRFLEAEKPDLVLLQEIKATENTFPFFELQLAGYEAVISGQKSYNGVALLSRRPLTAVQTALPGFEDQARFVQADLPTGQTVICVYVPNGNPPAKNPTDTSRLEYKLAWMKALTDHARRLVRDGHSLILGGDFNVIERDDDVYNADLFRETALMTAPVRQAYRNLLSTPLDAVIRRFNPMPHTYSFWDFQGGARARNNGILLDAFLVSSDLSDRVKSAKIYPDVRDWPAPSDHVPIGLVLAD